MLISYWSADVGSSYLAVPVRHPEAALGVAGHAVGIAVAFGNGGEDALAGELAVVRQVEDVDRALEGVAVVEPAVVRAEGGTVGDDMAALDVEGGGWGKSGR